MNKVIKNKEFGKIYILKILEIVLFVLISVSVFAIREAFASDITKENLLKGINAERTNRNIAPLNENAKLDQASLNKSNDMLERNYFEHYFNGLTPWDWIARENYNYLYAGENLAMDFDTSEGMVKAWMDSPTHRANILNPDFNETGIGIVKGQFSDGNGARETTIVTNMFGREKPQILVTIDSWIKNIRTLFSR